MLHWNYSEQEILDLDGENEKDGKWTLPVYKHMPRIETDTATLKFG
ncbi:hypothetical protein [Alteromonas sp. PRIM-21]|nr:hypothetical protein [Alteromonas sp. PRIM-21]MCZ8530142.1 hypothetical protein [Alteromonas sp. PRIM-21]